MHFPKMLTLSAGVMLLSGATVSVTKDVQATSIPLECNGSNFMNVQYGDGSTSVEITIGHASQGYDYAPVPPNNCAWHDRGMNGNEPFCIAFNGATPTVVIQHGSGYDPNNGADPNRYIQVGCGSNLTSVQCAVVQSYWPHYSYRFMIGSAHDQNGCMIPVSATQM